MICVSIAEPTLAECQSALKGIEFAEFRLDKTSLSVDDVRTLYGSPAKLIATCRPGTRSEEERLAVLLAAVSAGAAYVDIELESPASFRQAVLGAARERGCRAILSYLNAKETPLKQVLSLMIEECFDSGADIAKIVCQVRSTQDCVRLLSLYETRKNVIALGMGPLGFITRIAAPFLGAPLTYASLAPGKETAEGQPDLKTLEALMKYLKNP